MQDNLELNHTVYEAVNWLRSFPISERPQPLISAIRERFGLTAVEICEVIAIATREARMRNPDIQNPAAVVTAFRVSIDRATYRSGLRSGHPTGEFQER